MSAVWQKTLVYLGLVEESEETIDLTNAESADGPAASRREPVPAMAGAHAGEAAHGASSNVRPLRAVDAPASSPTPSTSASARPLGAEAARVVVLEVSGFEDAEEIGFRYRSGQPVVFDLVGVDTTAARRVLDFVSGVTFALRGRLSKVGVRAFLLVPDGVEVSDTERTRLAGLGYRLEG